MFEIIGIVGIVGGAIVLIWNLLSSGIWEPGYHSSILLGISIIICGLTLLVMANVFSKYTLQSFINAKVQCEAILESRGTFTENEKQEFNTRAEGWNDKLEYIQSGKMLVIPMDLKNQIDATEPIELTHDTDIQKKIDQIPRP